jgi:putative PIN family toxin of toxin-antitoxin system
MRMVLDTNVIVAAMRSPGGASAFLLKAAKRGAIQPCATTALCLEYESVCRRPSHVLASGLSNTLVTRFLDGVIGLCEPVDVWFRWRPQLRDPADEFVLEAAANAGASLIVTFNGKDFIPAARAFGIEISVPNEVVRRLP